MTLPGIVAQWIIWSGLMGIGQFIYDYQTLIAGIIAVGAAYIAALPVWRQLELTQTQANGVLREMLLQRQAEVRQANAASMEKVNRPLNEMDFAFGIDEVVTRISEHDAHHFEMGLSHAVSWLRRGYPWHDGPAVESAKKTLIADMDALITLLAEVRMPDSIEQHDEDHSISDEDWAALVGRGEAAKDEVPNALSITRASFRVFLDQLESEKAAIESRLGKVNEALASA